jgi:hypothetical protein
MPIIFSSKNKLWLLLLMVAFFSAATGASLRAVGGGGVLPENWSSRYESLKAILAK